MYENKNARYERRPSVLQKGFHLPASRSGNRPVFAFPTGNQEIINLKNSIKIAYLGLDSSLWWNQYFTSFKRCEVVKTPGNAA